MNFHLFQSKTVVSECLEIRFLSMSCMEGSKFPFAISGGKCKCKPMLAKPAIFERLYSAAVCTLYRLLGSCYYIQNCN
jgi:hypothetical protein